MKKTINIYTWLNIITLQMFGWCIRHVYFLYIYTSYDSIYILDQHSNLVKRHDTNVSHDTHHVTVLENGQSLVL